MANVEASTATSTHFVQTLPIATTGYSISATGGSNTGNFAIDIRGGNYQAVIGNDGWAIFRDVPIMGFVPKGEKSAPEDINEAYMQKMVSFSQEEYQAGNFAAPIHKGHHKSLAIEDPEFLGFFLPKRVGTAMVEGKSTPAIFADLKFKPSAFLRAQSGELPYFSPEVDWITGKFMSLAALDSNPPHFKFPMFTVGLVVEDRSAKFEAALKSKLEADPKEKSEGEKGCCAHCATYQKKYGVKFEERLMTNPVTEPKAPVEPTTPAVAVMQADPKVIAAFEAKLAVQADALAELKKKDAERDAKEKAKGLFEKALGDLKGYQFGENVRKALFAAAGESEEKLTGLVAAVKEVATKEPPKTLEEAIAASVSTSDPALTKFQKDSPARQAKAAQFLAEYREIKKVMKGYSLSAEAHVDLEMRKLMATEGGN